MERSAALSTPARRPSALARLKARMALALGLAAFGACTAAFAGISGITGIVLALVLALVLPLILVPVAAGLAPNYFASLGILYDAVKNATFGDPIVDPIAPIMASILLIIGLFGFIGVAAAVLVIKFRGGSAKSS